MTFFSGRLATIANLENPVFWTNDELIFIPELQSSIDSAYREIKGIIKTLHDVPSSTIFYDIVPDDPAYDCMSLFAEFSAYFYFKFNRFNPRRQTFKDDFFYLKNIISTFVFKFGAFKYDAESKKIKKNTYK